MHEAGICITIQNFSYISYAFIYFHEDGLFKNGFNLLKTKRSGFGGLVVSMLASGAQDRGFDPGRSRRIFRAKKSTACLPWGGGK